MYTLYVIAVGYTDGMSGPQKVLSDRHNLAAVADSNWAVVAVGIVVAWLLVVLETLHEWQEVWVKWHEKST